MATPLSDAINTLSPAVLTPGEALQRALLPSIGGTTAPRVPFVFSSAARLSKSSGTSFGQVADPTLLDLKTAGTTSGADAGTQTGRVNVAGQSVLKTIALQVNPHALKWTQPKRFHQKPTMQGSTFFHFTDKNGRNDGIATLQFSMRTGNININGIQDETQRRQALYKLSIWHEMENLALEPMYVPGFGANEMYIYYSTQLFPMNLRLIGFFNTPPEINEDAMEPYNRSGTFAFTITSTDPPLYTVVQQINNVLTGSTS